MATNPAIFTIRPFFTKFNDVVRKLVEPAISKAGVLSIGSSRDGNMGSSGVILDDRYFNAIRESNLTIADVTDRHDNVIYELGYAQALRKPAILISSNPGSSPFDLKFVPVLRYTLADEVISSEVNQLAAKILEATSSPDSFLLPIGQRDEFLNRVFVSYSHKDAEYLARVLVHLKPLQRTGVVDVWSDVKLTPGDSWQREVWEGLIAARVAILLISADFLASDFIVNNELPPLLKQAQERGTRIVPIVLRPCRFSRDTLINGFQSLNDPAKPLSLLHPDEQEAHFDRLSALIEHLFPPRSAD